jgi:phosphotriesterase-related protein
MAKFIETVLGPVASDRLGTVLPHEHVPLLLGDPTATEILGPPAGYEQRLLEWELQALRDAQACGAGTLVEVTPIGLRRWIGGMKTLSRRTGVHIVASTGFYIGPKMPAWVNDREVDELADLMCRELTEGIADTGARAWMIKVATSAKPARPLEAKVFQAAAKASNATGAAITTHSCGNVRQDFDLLVQAGADPARLYIGHADFGGGKEDLSSDEQLYVARNGGHLIFTCWGIQHFVDQAVLARRVTDVIAAGLAESVLVSTDYALGYSSDRMSLISSEYECPWRTHAYLFRYTLPALRAAGLDEATIRQITVDNPRIMLERPRDGDVAAAGPAAAEAVSTVRAEITTAPSTGGLEARPFGPDTEADALAVANEYLVGWPYTRAIDAELVARWKTLPEYQSQNMLVAYRDGRPRAFLHGEIRPGEKGTIHLLAAGAGAAAEGAWLLGQFERKVRAGALAPRLVSPHWAAATFYAGYVLGREPYHPHWAIDATEAYVRAGFGISHPAVILIRDLWHEVDDASLPKTYELSEPPPPEEWGAEAFGYYAMAGDARAALCFARLYRDLHSPTGGCIGQIGYVDTIEAHRGKGLARILCQLCLRRLRKMGASEVLIATGLNNLPALRAYERAGFQRRYNINEWSKLLG